MDFPPARRTGGVSRHLDNNPEDIANHRISDMADAMSLAMSKARNPEDPDPDPYGYATELESARGWQLLDPEWQAKPDDTQWNKRFKARARKAIVSKLYLQGYTVPEIAQRAQCTDVTVCQDLENIAKEYRRSYLDDIELVVGKDLARFESYLVKLSPAIERGDVKAIMAAVEIIKERGAILGSRTGVKVDIESYIRGVAESNGYDPDKAIAIAQRVSITMK